jgi:hypothetical protein
MNPVPVRYWPTRSSTASAPSCARSMIALATTGLDIEAIPNSDAVVTRAFSSRFAVPSPPESAIASPRIMGVGHARDVLDLHLRRDVLGDGARCGVMRGGRHPDTEQRQREDGSENDSVHEGSS